MNVAVYVLLGAILAPLPAISADPASHLCDRGGGASRADRAMNVIRFHQAIEREITALQKSQIDCVTRRLDEVVPAVDAYCGARGEIGHDLATEELGDLDSELMSLSFECDREDRERDMESFEKIAPETCSDLIPSYRALAEIYRNRENARSWIQCLTEKLDAVAPPVVRMCTEAVISVRAAHVEIGERVFRLCPTSQARE